MGHNDGCILRWDGTELKFGIAIGCTGFPYTGMAMPATDQGWAISEEGYIYRFNRNGWSESSTLRTSGALWGVAMGSTESGWAAGQGGNTARYASGRWSQSSPIMSLANGRVTSVYISPSGDVWATATIGDDERADGAIFRFRDNRWEQAAYTLTNGLNAIWVDDRLTNGWAVGNDGFVMRYVIPTE
jgi:hypothetical protein